MQPESLDSRSAALQQIAEVIHRYSSAMDLRHWQLMDEVFVPEATVEMNGFLFARNREHAVAVIRAAIECCSITHHMNSNIELLEFGATYAKVRNRFRAWHRGKAPRERLVFEALGTYDDEFVPTTQGWRILHRSEHSPIEIGEPSATFFADAMPVFATAMKPGTLAVQP